MLSAEERKIKDAEKHRRYYANDLEKSRAKSKETYSRNIERQLERKKEYYVENRDEILLKNSYSENKQSNIKAVKSYRNKHQDMDTAHKIARKIKLKDECELCGKVAEVKHHPDYTNPSDVMHICNQCHLTIHHGEKIHLKGVYES